MSRGSIDESAVYVREVIRRAIELGSAALILVHNHPSGDPAPSRADIEITRNVIAAGKRMGIEVPDHLIIGRGGDASLRRCGERRVGKECVRTCSTRWVPEQKKKKKK